MKVRAVIPYAVILALACLTGCMVGPAYRRPSAPAPQTFKEAPPQGWKVAQPNEAVLRGNWWELYNDPQLNDLERQVDLNNQNIRLAEAQYRQAREQVRIARAALFPAVSAAPTVTNARTSSNLAQSGAVNLITGARTDYTLPVDVSYQADIWGSIRRSVAAGYANAQVSAAELENARLTTHAQLAEFYFELRGLDAVTALLTNADQAYSQYLRLTQDRLELGVASGADVALAQTQLETTRVQLIDAGVLRAQYEHAIATLMGMPPSAVTIPPAMRPQVSPVLPPMLPSVLLERRPDIAASERQVAAANEQIGIAKAAYFPALTLSATAGLESSSTGSLFAWPSRFWSVGPQLAQTLFSGGRLHAQVAVQEAAYDATVANYRQTVLTALQQVEDNLSALRILEQEAAAEERAVEAARESLDISTEQYKAGIANYLQVITAQTIALQDQVTAVNIQARRMTTSVQLVEALGGGWSASQLPTRDAILHGR